ncbi:MAG: hypothetical protein OEN50_17580, partial [Deltaproteobacteria bacterium]|nr:hypothetical protein [Deltaproteobacteria bacterium]
SARRIVSTQKEQDMPPILYCTFSMMCFLVALALGFLENSAGDAKCNYDRLHELTSFYYVRINLQL